MPATRIFALIIGIDSYKSGHIWNLHACVEDAKKMTQWLNEEFNVPRDQVCLLLDSQATKSNIENSFMEHLVNNRSIEPGDAILIYFAGHGSSIPAPSDWYHGESKTEMVEVLCPYDHDTRATRGRVAGISDRSFHAMIHDLASCKGNNITVFLDCCFSPLQTPANILERCTTRWTKTIRAGPDDLYRSLWPTARGKTQESTLGFSQSMASHIALLASSPGKKCTENKDGGRFTSNLLHALSGLPLHRTSYVQLMEHLQQLNEGSQNYLCVGTYRDRILFDGLPFLPDNHFLPTSIDEETGLIKIAIGAVHGVAEGAEFSLHLHNFHYSRNPSIAAAVVSDVRTLWCLARFKSRPFTLPTLCWAQVTRWNNRRPFRIYLKSSFSSFFPTWRLWKVLPTKPGTWPVKSKLQVMRVKRPDLADISLSVGSNSVSVTQHTSMLPQSNTRTIQAQSRNPIEVIDDAACFNMHLSWNNINKPLRNLIDMEICRIDPLSWSKISGNYLKDGTATIPHEEGAIYQIDLHNNSNIDLWPSVMHMDPSQYRISTAYSSACSEEAPLQSRGSLKIGSGETGSEAFTFPLDGHSSIAFLKVFFSSAPVSMSILEQNTLSFQRDGGVTGSLANFTSRSGPNTPVIWDTALAQVVSIRQGG